MQTTWILDLAAVAVAIVFVIWGVRRGFIRTAVHLIGGVVALVAAALISTPVAQWVYDQFLQVPLTEFVSDQVQLATVAAANTLQEQLSAVFAGLPPFLSGLLGLYDPTALTADGAVLATNELTTMIVGSILRPVCVTLVQMVAFLVVFLIAYAVMRLLGGALHKVFASLPLLNRINDALGGVLGFAESLLVIYLLTLLLELYMTMAGAGSVVTPADIEATYILRHFTDVGVHTLTVFG